MLPFECTAGEENDAPSTSKIRKSFVNLSGKWKRERTDNLLDKIEKLVKEENGACANDEELMTTTQLLGYIIHRINYEN